MPVAALGAVAAAVASSFTITAGALTFLGWGPLLLRVAVGLVLTGLQTALSPKPKKPSSGFTSDQGFTQSVKQPLTSHRHIYGQALVGGPYAYAGTSSDNQHLHIVIVLAAHQVASIDEVWLDDKVIPNDYLDASGNVTQGTYSGFLRIKKHLGEENQVADSDLVAEVSEWTTNHRLRGRAYIYLRLKYSQDAYPTGVPNISAVVRGKLLDDPRDSGNRYTQNIALYCYDYQKSTKYGFGATSSNLDTTNIAAQANICDEIVESQNLDTTISSVDASADIITLSGDRCPVQTCDRCEITTTGVAPAGLSTGTDYYVYVYQFRGTPRIKLATSLANALAGTTIDITDAGSGTHTLRRTGEPRYHGTGVLDTAQKMQDNFTDMLTGMAGKATYAGGNWRLLAGAYNAPTYNYNEDDLRGPSQIQTRLSVKDRFNQVQGKYVSPLNDFQPSDYPIVSSDTFIADDGGFSLLRALDLPYTNRALAAQRLASIGLRAARQEITETTKLNLRGLLTQAGDTCTRDMVQYGWSGKVFEVVSSGLGVEGGSQDAPGYPYVPVTLRETDESVYAAAGTDFSEVDPAPNTNLPNVFDVETPTGLSFSSRSTLTADGDTVYNLRLSWNAPTNFFILNGGYAEINYRLSSESDWHPFPRIQSPGENTSADITFNSIGVSYDIRIRFVNNAGVRGSWNTLLGAVVGSSGGVGATEDYGSWSGGDSTAGVTEDWGSWSGGDSTAGSSIDRGFWT